MRLRPHVASMELVTERFVWFRFKVDVDQWAFTNVQYPRADVNRHTNAALATSPEPNVANCTGITRYANKP